MSEEVNTLPDNIVSIDMLRINRNIDKRCKCAKKSFVVDSRNKSVHCGGCGAQVDAYDAIYHLASHYEQLRDQVKSLLEQRKQIVSYKPHMIVFRNLEKQYRGKNMLPACPHCSRGFYFEELKHWINTELEKKRRSREQGE